MEPMKRLNIIYGVPQQISKNKNKKTNSSRSPEVSLAEPWGSVRSTLRTYALMCIVDVILKQDAAFGKAIVILCCY